MSKRIEVTAFEEHFDAVKARLQEDGLIVPGRREDAFKSFVEHGLPTTKVEDWKYTNLKPLATKSFRPLSAPKEEGLKLKDLESYLINELSSHRLVFYNGTFAPWLSSATIAEDEIFVGSFEDLNKLSDKDLRSKIKSYLGSLAPDQGDALSALNTAFLADGAIVYLGSGTKLDMALSILFVNDASDDHSATYNRCLLIAEDDSEMTLVERHIGLKKAELLSSAITEISVGERANVQYFKIVQESDKATHLGRTVISQQESSKFAAFTFTLEGALVRNELELALKAPGCESTVNGLSLLEARQHVDNHTIIDHQAPDCESSELYKGIYSDTSRGVFSGTIIVQPDAQRTNAFQNNHSILLSRDAKVNARPQLKIWADDVKCTHGATVGELNEEALFYLRSRGIPEKAAQDMLVHAFASEVFVDIEHEAIRSYFETLLTDKLGLAG